MRSQTLQVLGADSTRVTCAAVSRAGDHTQQPDFHVAGSVGLTTALLQDHAI